MEINATELPLYLLELEQTEETGLLMIFDGQTVATTGFRHGQLVHFLFQGKSNRAAITAFCKSLQGRNGDLKLQFRKGNVDNKHIKTEDCSQLAEYFTAQLDSHSAAVPASTRTADKRHTVPLDDEMKPILREIALLFLGPEGAGVAEAVIAKTRTLRTAFLFLTSEVQDQEHCEAMAAELRARLKPLATRYLAN